MRDLEKKVCRAVSDIYALRSKTREPSAVVPCLARGARFSTLRDGLILLEPDEVAVPEYIVRFF